MPAPELSGWRASDIHDRPDPRQLNQLDFRGRRIEYRPSDYVVVLVGDSQVEALAAAFDEMPEARLEAHLRAAGLPVRVFSLGTSGYGQDQQLLALHEYFARYRADLVLAWETPLNDVWNNLFPTHSSPTAFAKPTFWLEGEALRGPSEPMRAPIRETPPLRLQLLWQRAFGWSRDAAWEASYPPAYRGPATSDRPVKDDWQRRWDADPSTRERENLATEKSHLAPFLAPRSPRMRYALDLTRRLLGEMATLCAAHGARFAAFATSADPSTVPEDRTFFEGRHALDGRVYETSRAQYEDNLREMNRGIDFGLVAVRVDDWRASATDFHLNPRAIDVLFADLARDLEPLVAAAAASLPAGKAATAR